MAGFKRQQGTVKSAPNCRPKPMAWNGGARNMCKVMFALWSYRLNIHIQAGVKVYDAS